MELDALRSALDEGEAPATPLPGRPGTGEGAFLIELRARHSHSTQASSRQLLAIASALVEVVRAEGLAPTPTALFAAGMAGLDRPDTAANPELLAGMAAFLDALLPRVPPAVLRAKLAPAASVLAGVLAGPGASEPGVARHALGGLAQLLACTEQGDWLAVLPAFSGLVHATQDPRPKVRRRAQEGLREALAGIALVPRPALVQASAAVAEHAERVLPGPAAAAVAAAAAPAKRRAEAEAGIVAATAAALHLLGTLQRCLPLLEAGAARRVARLCLALLPLRQALLSRQSCVALAALLTSSKAQDWLTPDDAGELIKGILRCELGPEERRDPEAVAARRAVLLAGLSAARSAGEARGLPDAAAVALPRVLAFFVPLLAAELDAVRADAAGAASQALTETIDAPSLTAELTRVSAQGGAPKGLVGVAACLQAALGTAGADGWMATLGLCRVFFERLGRAADGSTAPDARRRAADLVAPLLVRVAELCDAGADEESRAEADDKLARAAQDALGGALSCLGVRAVLSIVPLGLRVGKGSGKNPPRTWLIPLIRLHGGGGDCGYWAEELLPLAQQLRKRGEAATSSKRADEANLCGMLEFQIWNTLPAFMAWARDGARVWQSQDSLLTEAFNRNEQYRTVVCTTMATLCSNIRDGMAAAGEQVGHPTAVDRVPSADAAVTGDGGDSETDWAPPTVGLLSARTGDEQTGSVPAGYSADIAQAELAALRAASVSWLPRLLEAFVAAAPGARGPLETPLARLAAVAEPSAVARLFKADAQRLVESVGFGAAAGGAGMDGGAAATQIDAEQVAGLLDVALLLAGGLPARGVATLVKLATQFSARPEPAVQKKAYKALGYVCASRSDAWDGAAGAATRDALLQAVVAGRETAASAAKRHRLRCVQWAVLQLAAGVEASTAGGEEERAEELRLSLSALVGEVVMSVKEANLKTRTAGFEALVELAHAMQAASPGAGARAGAGPASLQSLGGLGTLVTVVLGGLVGASPHAISASVMALARLVHEFSAALLGLVPELLPTVLLLLRSRAREVIKSVLGFVKVAAARLPATELEPALPGILEGILLWAEDSKNKFRLKVRMILERLARRCGFEALERAMPPAHARLLTHIRKANARGERAREGARSEAGDRGRAGRSEAGRSVARTARGGDGETVWDATRVFSERAATAKSGSSARRGADRGGHAAADPQDLNDPAVGRALLRGAARERRRGDSDGEDSDEAGAAGFPTDAGTGRMVVDDPEAGAGRKRARASAHFDSDDSDFEDLQGLSGLDLALKGAQSVGRAKSIAASIGGKSLAGRSAGGRTAGSAKSRGTAKSGVSRRAQHSGERFRSGKAGGDVKKGGVEPYAYWPLDRRLMNRRANKVRGAKQGLDEVINAGRRATKRSKKAP